MYICIEDHPGQLLHKYHITALTPLYLFVRTCPSLTDGLILVTKNSPQAQVYNSTPVVESTHTDKTPHVAGDSSPHSVHLPRKL